ncbi:unnamed protein product [Cyprideis torosa]|uniref:Uncharacterized protein n=1 Tax=Cyprideis torosa TaxID=163714 RepID=A0A7R8ZRT6_9CRUS|nr:unnamed protein product [Cyprideis torosa]CAG0905451.1 unnamed protein product [Cyprideis torosa]
MRTYGSTRSLRKPLPRDKTSLEPGVSASVSTRSPRTRSIWT